MDEQPFLLQRFSIYIQYNPPQVEGLSWRVCNFSRDQFIHRLKMQHNQNNPRSPKSYIDGMWHKAASHTMQSLTYLITCNILSHCGFKQKTAALKLHCDQDLLVKLLVYWLCQSA